MLCPQCGNNIPDGSPSCPVCGMQFAPVADPAAETVAAPPDPALSIDPYATMSTDAYASSPDILGGVPADTGMDMGMGDMGMGDMGMGEMGLDPSLGYGSEFYSPYSEQMVPDMGFDPSLAGMGGGVLAASQPMVRIIHTTQTEEDKPITFWQAVGMFLLGLFPGVGIIVMIVFSLSKGINKNLRTFSRAWLVLFVIIPVIVALIVMITMVLTTGSLTSCLPTGGDM